MAREPRRRLRLGGIGGGGARAVAWSAWSVGLAVCRPPLTACPPSCANNELVDLFDTYCSDKGTFWQSKHHYGSAYHALFGSITQQVRSVLEVGIGEDTAPSVATWLRYFPHAHIYPVDIKTTKEVADRAKPGGATEKLVKHQAKFGCEYNASMWSAPRVHLTLNTDASKPEQLQRVRIPSTLDVIIDDGSHRFGDQEATLLTLWPRLSPGGFYVVEDVLVGALPWDAAHARQVPSNNSGCGHECFFPQRLAEHPFMFDRFGYEQGPSQRLAAGTRELLRANDWFWVVTGVHKGGGLDCSLIIRKKGPPIAANSAAPTAAPTAAATAAAVTPPSALRELEAARKEHAELKERQGELRLELQRAMAASAPHPPVVCPACGGEGGGAGAAGSALLAASVALNVLQLLLRWRSAAAARPKPQR